MTFNDLLEEIKRFEGFRATAYKCPAGVWTIGYGRTKNVLSTSVTTKENEEKWLYDEVYKILTYVENFRDIHKYNWTRNQLYALTDFCFNLGTGALVKLTSAGNRYNNEIAEKMLLYVNANGKPLDGLKTRRKWESELFKTMEEPIKNTRKARMLFRINKEWMEFTGYCTTEDKAIFKNMQGREIEVDEDIQKLITQITFYADDTLW